MLAQTLAATPPIRKNRFATVMAVVMFVALPSAIAAAQEAPFMKASETAASIATVDPLQAETLDITRAPGSDRATNPLLPSQGMTDLPPQTQQAPWVKAVIKAIQKFGPRTWSACVSAVRRGYGAWRAWYDSQPRALRWSIGVVSGGANLLTIYDALRSVVGRQEIQPAGRAADPAIAPA